MWLLFFVVRAPSILKEAYIFLLNLDLQNWSISYFQTLPWGCYIKDCVGFPEGSVLFLENKTKAALA